MAYRAYRIARPDTAFSLSPAKGKRRPRVHADDYLRWIRTLPCVLTGTRGVEAAHIRTAAPEHGKRSVGAGEKPDDRWALPLAPGKHREQHTMNEMDFWLRHAIDPFRLALALWGAQFDDEAAEEILTRARQTAATMSPRTTAP